MDISLLGDILIKSFHSLNLRQRSQGGNSADLGLASGEHGTAVDSRDQIDFRCQRTDLVDGSSVRSLVILEDHLADSLLLILIHRIRKDREPLFIVCPCFADSVSENTDILFSLLLYVCEDCVLHLCRRNDLLQSREYLFRNCR